MPYVFALDELRHPSAAEVGGKGLGLWELASKGFQVPRTLVLSTQAYLDYTAEPSHQGKARAPPKASLAEQAQRMRNAFLLTGLDGPSPVLEKVLDELEAKLRVLGLLGPGGMAPLAVRSSATNEDAAARSFAGSFRTELNVAGRAALGRAIRSCWASTAQPEFLRRGGGPPAMALVVQELIRPDVSGVALTETVTGQPGVVIEAVWGLAKGLVDGAVSPDHFVVGADGTLLESSVGAKEVTFVAGTAGVEQRATAPEQRAKLCLDSTQAVAMGRTFRAVQGAFGRPMDIEWAMAGGTLYLLQARPIVNARSVQGP